MSASSLVVATAAAVCSLALGACSGVAGSNGASPPTLAAPTIPTVQADDRTARIAAVEARRLCDVANQPFPQEADISRDLDRRLSEAGITHLEWKNWHDELATSPSLVTQFADLTRTAC